MRRVEGWAIGPTELIIVLVIVLLLFGARRIPEIARSIGSGAREFREGISGKADADAPGELPEERSDKDQPPHGD